MSGWAAASQGFRKRDTAARCLFLVALLGWLPGSDAGQTPPMEAPPAALPEAAAADPALAPPTPSVGTDSAAETSVPGESRSTMTGATMAEDAEDAEDVSPPRRWKVALGLGVVLVALLAATLFTLRPR